MNRVAFHGHPSGSFRACFGDVISISAMYHVAGLGHSEKILVCFAGGLSMELSQRDAAELQRRLGEQLNRTPLPPDCAGEVWRGE